MFRRSMLPRAFTGLAFGLAVAGALAPAMGQDLSTQERLDRLERDLNMLQRQIYRGAPPSMPAGSGAAVSIEIRMDRLEAEMRDLTGRVEEAVNQVERVRQRLDQGAGASPGAVATADPAAAAPEPPRSDRPALQFPPPPPGDSDEDAATRRPGASAGLMPPPGTFVLLPDRPTSEQGPGPGPGPGGGPTPIFGTLRPPGSPAAPAELASTAAGPHPGATGLLPSGSVSEQYNHAFGLLKKADYPAAEAALKAFIAAHPRDAMAGNAQYWLGETYYTRGRYPEAASAFAEGYKRYPKSAKAADDLLKLGMSLDHANQKKNACLAFAQLDHDFPHPGAAVKDRAAAEKKRLGC